MDWAVRGYNPCGGKGSFCLYTRSDTLWGPPIYLLNGCGRSFLESKSCRSVMLTTHLHLARRLRVCGAEPMEWTQTILCLVHSFFWVIPRRLNFMCRRFGTLCSVFIDSAYTIQFRIQGITQKKECNNQNTAKL
jgi:hypothetical protein